MNDTHINCKCERIRLQTKELLNVVGLTLLAEMLTHAAIIELKNEMGLSINDIKSMGVTKQDILDMYPSRSQLTTWGFSDKDLKDLGFSDDEIANF